MDGEVMPKQKKKGGVTLRGFDFHAVPEGCIAAIAAFTTPIDACRLAVVSRDFKSASESDVVWESFLPADCDLIVSRSDSGEAVLNECKTKKQLYMCLADRPLLFHAATKVNLSFFLDKSSGKKCWMIAARSLSITWGDTPRYWKWTSIPESRFPEVAELQCVCWLEIRGKIRTSMLSPSTRYAAYLVLKMAEEAYGLHNASEASVTSGGKTETQVVHFSNQEFQFQRVPSRGFLGFRGFNRLRLPSFEFRQSGGVNQSPKPRTDGWEELKIGEFFTNPGQDDQVELSVMETKTGNWKTGLIIEGIEVRPA